MSDKLNNTVAPPAPYTADMDVIAQAMVEDARAALLRTKVLADAYSRIAANQDATEALSNVLESAFASMVEALKELGEDLDVMSQDVVHT